jgi:hypothetical protein
MARFCTDCAAPLESGAKFCMSCGSAVEGAASIRIASPSRSTPPPLTAARPPVSRSSSAPAIAPAQAPVTATAAEVPRPVAVATPALPAMAAEPGELESSAGPHPASRFVPRVLAALAIVAVVAAFFFYRSRGAHPPSFSDPDIAHSIQTKFAADPALSKYAVDVNSQNGVVTLTGLVNQESDKTAASSIAAQQPGVKQVNVYGLIVNKAAPSTEETAQGEPPVDGSSPSATNDPVPALQSNTVVVQGNQRWSATNTMLQAGDVVIISATGTVFMGQGWPPMPPAGRPPNCERQGGFTAAELPCWSLIGRIGEHGKPFYVGNRITLRAPASGPLFLGVNDDRMGDNSGSWTVTISAPGVAPTPPSVPAPPPGRDGRPAILGAVLKREATSLQLPSGNLYLFGMVTGGAAPSSSFAQGPYAQVTNASGNLSAALAYGTNDEDSFTTETAYHDIGGVSVSGPWDSFAAFYGSNPQSGAPSASVSFPVEEESLVVAIGMASSQQFVSLQGIPGLQVDASERGSGLVIAHAYIQPGTYTIVELSKALSAGQDPPHMADLVGVFVFGSKH